MLVFYIQSLEFRVSQDPLTSLNNRRQLVRYCSQRSNLYMDDRRTVVVMMDIDRFKSINDTYGHAEGDRALMVVSEALKKAVNGHSMPSFLCRYGGDEFIIITHPIGMHEVDDLIREIRNEINKAELTYALSISAGCAELKGSATFRDCVKEADEKLYQDKRR